MAVKCILSGVLSQARNLNIDFLVLNAAVKATPKWYTKEGHELQMGAQHVQWCTVVQRHSSS